MQNGVRLMNRLALLDRYLEWWASTIIEQMLQEVSTGNGAITRIADPCSTRRSYGILYRGKIGEETAKLDGRIRTRLGERRRLIALSIYGSSGGSRMKAQRLGMSDRSLRRVKQQARLVAGGMVL